MNDLFERTNNIKCVYAGTEINLDLMMKLLCESLDSIIKNSDEVQQNGRAVALRIARQ